MIDKAISDLGTAREAVFSVLRTLEGDERREGIRKALEAMGATELARGLGISRERVYQLTRDRRPTTTTPQQP